MKNGIRIFFLLVVTNVHVSCSSATKVSFPDEVDVIAFGSCADEKMEQPFWTPILEANPDILLLMGDNVYADTDDPAVFASAYQKLGSDPGFKRVRSRIPILATWDDHDYGLNDGGKEYKAKDIAKQAFMDFFNIARDDEMTRHGGVYSSHIFGKEGRRVQIIMLDTRYFRDPLTPRPENKTFPYPGRYVPSTDSTVTTLGEEQWAWLEQQLLTPADLRILVSSIQVVPDEHGWEKWGNHPLERSRLFSLIKQTNANGLLVLSGDRHLAEISRLPTSDPLSPGYEVLDITSSGLNRGGGGQADEPNRYRLGENFRDNNFGLIRVDWSKTDPEIEIEIRNDKNEIGLSYNLVLSDLQISRN